MSRKHVVIVTETLPIEGQRHTITTATEHVMVVSFKQFTSVGNYRGAKADVIMLPRLLPLKELEEAEHVAKIILLEHADQSNRIVYY